MRKYRTKQKLYLINILTNLLSSSSCRKYTIERRTVATNIPYFVTENFHEYQGSLGRLEAAVEDEYKTNLRYACNRERNYSEIHFFVMSAVLLLYYIINTLFFYQLQKSQC